MDREDARIRRAQEIKRTGQSNIPKSYGTGIVKGLQMMYEMGKKSDAPKTKSYAPPGMENQVKGNLEMARGYELRHALPHNIKNVGKSGGSKSYLPYRKPTTANDSGGTSGGMA